jgi:hypothetical protein
MLFIVQPPLKGFPLISGQVAYHVDIRQLLEISREQNLQRNEVATPPLLSGQCSGHQTGGEDG